MYLGPGEALVSGLVLELSASLGFRPLPMEQGIVGQDSGVGLEHVVERVEAVGAADLLAGAERRAIGVVEVSVCAHEAQQLHLERAHPLLCTALGVGGPVKGPPVAL